jgi:hypothetical protein
MRLRVIPVKPFLPAYQDAAVLQLQHAVHTLIAPFTGSITAIIQSKIVHTGMMTSKPTVEKAYP